MVSDLGPLQYQLSELPGVFFSPSTMPDYLPHAAAVFKQKLEDSHLAELRGPRHEEIEAARRFREKLDAAGSDKATLQKIRDEFREDGAVIRHIFLMAIGGMTYESVTLHPAQDTSRGRLSGVEIPEPDSKSKLEKLDKLDATHLREKFVWYEPFLDRAGRYRKLLLALEVMGGKASTEAIGKLIGEKPGNIVRDANKNHQTHVEKWISREDSAWQLKTIPTKMPQ